MFYTYIECIDKRSSQIFSKRIFMFIFFYTQVMRTMKDVLSIIWSQIVKREDEKQLIGTSYSIGFFNLLIYIAIVRKKEKNHEHFI